MSMPCVYRMCSGHHATHHTVHAWPASQPPYVYVGVPGITYNVPVRTSQSIFIKNNHPRILAPLNMRFANQNVLERILIAMLNENKGQFAMRNFRICAEETRSTSVQAVGIIRPIGMELSHN